MVLAILMSNRRNPETKWFQSFYP